MILPKSANFRLACGATHALSRQNSEKTMHLGLRCFTVTLRTIKLLITLLFGDIFREQTMESGAFLGVFMVLFSRCRDQISYWGSYEVYFPAQKFIYAVNSYLAKLHLKQDLDLHQLGAICGFWSIPALDDFIRFYVENKMDDISDASFY